MDQKVVIIGAGVAGLIAAQHLEKEGLSPLIIESTDRLGGRLKTENIGGFLLDKGFQIVLSDYPEVQNYLNLEALQVAPFDPGAIIFHKGKRFLIADPIRKPIHALQTLFAPIGTPKDKWLILKLRKLVSKQSPEMIFTQSKESTLSFLKQFGFSTRIIDRFFKPFFTGIFLTETLQVSSAMFKYVFQLFSSGKTVLPANGIEAVPQQIAQKLSKTSFLLNEKVVAINDHQIQLASGSIISAKAIIIAADPAPMVKQLINQEIKFYQTTNYYFKIPESILKRATLGIVADHQSTINSFFEPTLVQKQYSNTGENLFSVSLKPNLITQPTIDEIIEELAGLTNKPKHFFEFIHSFTINKALPIINPLKYSLSPTEVKLKAGIFLAGDYLLYPSLDAAMKSGRIAAQAAINYLKDA
jgi:phytoene dehydrogenase-like protein